jgi:hypothetical protein
VAWLGVVAGRLLRSSSWVMMGIDFLAGLGVGGSWAGLLIWAGR